MNILLTGSTGFIGSALLSNNINNKFRLVLRNENTASDDNVFKVDSICSATVWAEAFKNIDCIVHLAGLAHSNIYTEAEYNDVNVEGTLHFAREAEKSGVKRFIFMSSIGVLGNSASKLLPFSEKSLPSPHSAYSESKYKAEQGLLNIASSSNLELVIIRPSLVYGQGAPGNFGRLVTLVEYTPLLPFALCHNKRSFISVDNLVNFIETCIHHPKAVGETFLISDNSSISLKEFTSAIAKGLGTTLIQLPVPVSLMRYAARLIGKSHLADQLLSDLQVDTSKARNLLGWNPPENMIQAMKKLNRIN